jgi:hypothetical protein
MWTQLSTLLSTNLLAGTATRVAQRGYRWFVPWLVLLTCAAFTGLGVFLSYQIIPISKEVNSWYVGIIITIGMLSVTYYPKYLLEESRNRFTPPEMIQYLLQGIIWPSAWPTLAVQLGLETPPIDKPTIPETTTGLLQFAHYLQGTINLIF